MNGLRVPGKAVREVITGSRKSCTNGKKDKTWSRHPLSRLYSHGSLIALLENDLLRQCKILWFKL